MTYFLIGLAAVGRVGIFDVLFRKRQIGVSVAALIGRG